MKILYLFALIILIFGCSEDVTVPVVDDQGEGEAEAEAESESEAEAEAEAEEEGECAPAERKCKDDYHAGYQNANCTWSDLESCINGCEEGWCLIDPDAEGEAESEDELNVTDDQQDLLDELEQRQKDLEKGIQRIVMEDLEFDPDELTIKLGATVIWEHKDKFKTSVLHYIKAHHEVFRSQARMEYGDTYNFTFNEAGTFTYFDIYYPDQMRGTIIVE